jgi:hypothetical protein
VPPEVTCGVACVVVGAEVVVVVATPADDAEPEVEEVGVVVVDVVPGEEADELDAPGCSLATTTPISTVAPAAATTAERVNRRMRRLAFSRDSVLGTSSSEHGRFRLSATSAVSRLGHCTQGVATRAPLRSPALALDV